jgi:hypothetical protein
MSEAQQLLPRPKAGEGHSSGELIQGLLNMGFGFPSKRESGIGETAMLENSETLRKFRPDFQGGDMGFQGEKRPAHEFEELKKRDVPRLAVTVPGRIKGFQRLMEKWGFSRKDAAEILGFENEGLIGELYAGIEKVQQRDVRDRLKLFLSLAVDLDGLYEEDQVIIEWFDQPKKLLRGKTPRQLLVEGSMENLLRVRQLIQYEANR